MNIEPNIPPITLKTFEKLVTPWLRNIEEERLTFVECHPSAGAYRRVRNIMEGIFLPRSYADFNNHFTAIQIDLRSDSVDSPEELDELIARRQSKNADKKTALFIISAEMLIYKNNASILRHLANMRSSGTANSVLFFECNLGSPDTMRFLTKIPNLAPQVCILSLFEEHDVTQFVKYLKAKWSMRISHRLEHEIAQQCGGLLLFVKSACAYIKDNPSADFAEIATNRAMLYNIMSIVENLSREEKEVMKAISIHNLDRYRNREAFEYLARIRFIEKQNNTWKLTVPLLQKYLQTSYESDNILNVDEKGHILLNAVPVDATFSKAERSLLMYFLAHPSVLISRDQLADSIWGKQSYEKYSDWAIDSHISRLRKRLMQLGYKKNVITTKKKQGVIFSNG